jgi:hypothetical protein
MMAKQFRYLALRFTIPAAGLGAMIILALLYQLEPKSYYRVLAFIGVSVFRYPFLDFQFILASVECWQHGTDVYDNNLCDVLNRGFNYPPLWLRFAFLPGKDWTNPIGLVLAASFFLALAVLPPPRSWRELLPRIVATLSPVTAFAVEKANIDLLVFVLATAAGVFLVGPLRRRFGAYAMIVIAGLLKIYPLVLMVLTLRERPRVFLLVNGAAAAVVLAMGVYFHAEIVRMVPNIPRAGVVDFPHAEVIGAHFLPDFIARMVEALQPRFSLRLVRLATFAALFLAMTGWFFSAVRWHNFRIALARLPEPEKIFLLIGAALISGCFFAGSSIGYRGIHLLFTLPGLVSMARIKNDMAVRRVAVQGYALVVALTWAGFFTLSGPFPEILAPWIGQLPSVHVARSLWLLFEVAWWQLATIFIAILVGCCSNWLEAVPEWRHLLRPGARSRVSRSHANDDPNKLTSENGQIVDRRQITNKCADAEHDAGARQTL